MTRVAVLDAPSQERLLALGVSHRTASLALLERLALSAGESARMLAEITSHGGIHEAVLLSTCNRMELYLVAADRAEAERIALASLSRSAGLDPGTLRLQSLCGAEVARHLFLVAAGLESMVVGETEIQGQVRRAYELALLEGMTGPITNQLFRGALEAGKRVRSRTACGRSQASVASVAVGLAVRRFGDLDGRLALVIGAGENGELAGRALARRGARMVFVAHRRRDRAARLARRWDGRAVGFDSLRTELADADLAFGCTASPRQIVTRDDVALATEKRHGRPLLLIDTAVPRDIDPSARDLPGVTLYDIDDLKRAVAGDDPSATWTDHAGRVIDHEVARFTAWLASLDQVPAISAVREHAEAVVEQVLREHEPLWESLSPADRKRVGLVAHAIVNRFLHQPTMRLKRSPGSETSRIQVHALRELFSLDGMAPRRDARSVPRRCEYDNRSPSLTAPSGKSR
jgi:glutamyl-tRNA reductase